MELFTQMYYNPYYVAVNGKPYCISRIAVFNSDGIIVINNQGWWGSNNNVRIRYFDCDCILKRKVDFTCTSAFIIKDTDNTYFKYFNEPRYVLYIPNSIIKLGKTYAIKDSDTSIALITKSTVFDDIIYSEYHSIAKTLSELSHKLNTLCKINYKVTTEKISDAKIFAENIKNLMDDIIAERKRLIALSVDDCLKELNLTINNP